jgi:hypothetical protein
VTKGSYPYPEDEFDVADDHGGPRGVHRAPRTTWSRLWPFLVVLVVVPALAYGLVTQLSSGDITRVLSNLGTSSESPEPTEDVGTPTPSATVTTPPVEPVAPTPDLALPVVVLNAAQVSGLAAEQVAVLADGGFTAASASNGSATGVTTSTVFYATDDQKVTADAVAQLLGITTVTLEADRADGAIAVLLLPDFVD